MRTAITGGIGSGKSYVCRLLADRGISVYDCDSNAKRLMVESPELRRRLTELIGPEAYLPNQSSASGQEASLPVQSSASGTAGAPGVGYVLNKPVIARFLMSSPENARAIEAIVHPAVIDDFLQSGREWVESAILFESGLDKFVDRVIVVTAPLEVRIARIMERDGITREKAIEWIDRQLPQEELVRRADIVIVNDGQQQPYCPAL